MGNVFTRNVGWKITSIILGFFIWFAIIRFEDPTVDKDFTVAVQVLNETEPVGDSDVITVKKQKQYITYDKSKVVKVKLEGKRSIIDNLHSSDLKATANVRELTQFGKVAIEVSTESGLEILRMEPRYMDIKLENSKTEIRTVEPNIIGEQKANYVVDTPTFKPATVEITGAESKVQLVVKATVDIQVDGLTKEISTIGKVRLYDAKGEEQFFEKSVEKVEVRVPVRKYKSISLIVNTTGKVAPGYRFTGSSISQNRVQIIGKEEVVDKITIINIPANLDGLNVNQDKEVDINDYLPEGVLVYEAGGYSKKATVKLSVAPIIEREVIIEHDDISIKKLPPNGLKLSILNTENITLTFRGIETELNRISRYTLSPGVDLSNLAEGTHQVPLILTYPDTMELVGESIPLINVEITKEAEEASSNNVSEETPSDSTGQPETPDTSATPEEPDTPAVEPPKEEEPGEEL